MGQVSVTVNGRAFSVNCEDGQEGRIRRLAHYVDSKIGDLIKTVGQAGEARLILMAALLIADELSDANDALAHERSRTRSSGGDASGGSATGIHGIAQRLETIASRLESS